MKIAVGTKSPPKINAVKEAVEKCIYFKNKEIEIISLNVDSDVSDMPISMEENMIGAENRAKNLQKKIKADFYVGMEGGTTYIQKETYLFGVVCIINNLGEKHFGFSNFMEIPKIFQREIYKNKRELGPVVDEIVGGKEISKKNGAFGILSDDMFTRKEQFMLAFLSAIVGFYNEYYKN